MAEVRLNVYEGLFLFPQAASGDLGATVEHLNELLRRAEAEIISIAKWDERRLAYDIRGNKRGLYILAYFKAPATRLVGLERDCNLSEHVLRALIVRADHMTEEQIQSADKRQALEDEIRLRASGEHPSETQDEDEHARDEETVEAEA